MSNTFDPFADLNPPTNLESSTGAVRRASAQASLDNNIFFGAPQGATKPTAPPANRSSSHSNGDPFASLSAAPVRAPPATHSNSAGRSDDPFAMLGSFNKPEQQSAPRPAPPPQSMGAPMRPAAPLARSGGWGAPQEDPFGGAFAPPAAAPPAPQQPSGDDDPFDAFGGLGVSAPSNQSSTEAVRRASAQASLDNNIFFGAPQGAAKPVAPPTNSSSGNNYGYDQEDPFAPPPPKASTPAPSGGWHAPQDHVFGGAFAPPVAAPAAPQQQPGDDDPFAAFGSKPAAPPQAPPAPAQSSWGSDDPFGSFPAKQPPALAPVAQSNNDWGFGDDDDFFSPPPPVQPAAAAPAAGRSSLQSPAHRNTAAGPHDAEEAMQRLRELYPTDDDDGGAPAARESHRPAGGRYATDHKQDNKDNNNLPTEGGILARLSTRSLFVKDWQEAYWVIQNNHLLLFRNKNDYEYNPGGTRVKKDVLISPKLRCQKVHLKEYSGYGNLYNFMLEEIEDFGPVNVAKFASRDRAAVDVLYVQLTMKISKAMRAASARNQC